MNKFTPEVETNPRNETLVTNATRQSMARSFSDVDVAMTVLRIFLPTIILFGTVGNLLSVVVLTRRGLRMTPIFFYLTLLSCADTLVLYVSGFKSWVRILTGYELLHSSDVGCRLLMYLLLCAFYLSSWLIVLVTVDRFIIIFFPFRGYILLRIKQARIASVCLTITVALYNLHVFWTYRLGVDEYGRVNCDSDDEDWFMNNLFEYLKFVSYSCVPFLIVTTLNVGIIVKISRQSRAFVAASVVLASSSASSCSQRGTSTYRRSGTVCPRPPTTSATATIVGRLGQRRLTRMLLLVSFVWLALTAPFTLHALFFDISGRPHSMLTKVVCFLLMYTNHAANFYLYCVTGQRFRNELRKVLRSALACSCSTLRRESAQPVLLKLRMTLNLR